MKILIATMLTLLTTIGLSQQLPQKITDDNQIIKHDGYIISYDETHEQPNWVYYVLKPSDLNGEKVKRKNKFKEDTLIPTGSATLKDYKGSGYDRGHLKPAGDEPTDRTQMDETFYLSNISPQVPSFNRGIWKKLENYVRTRALKSDSVIVITGPLLIGDLKTIGDSKVSVPRHFFKVMYIYEGDKLETMCFVLPNTKGTGELWMYGVRIEDLEKLIKIIF